MSADSARAAELPAEALDSPGEDAAAGPPPAVFWAWTGAGLVIVLLLAWATRHLEQTVPEWLADTAAADFAKAVEYPVYAILLGLLGALVVTVTGIRERVSAAFRTEFFIKTGLVLLGASINLSVIVSAAGPAILQALVLVTSVFFFTWWLAGRFGLDDRLRALLASAVSICGVSAAIAAVAAAGAIVGEEALQIAAIVKATQNVLMGVVAVALTAYFALRVDRRGDAPRPGLGALWQRFPKFVLGFLAASVIATWYLNAAGDDGKETIGIVNDLRTWFLILAFVSIGLEFRLTSLREAGWRPIAVFGGATVFNLALALAVASVLFRNFSP